MKKICWILSALTLLTLTSCGDSEGTGGGGGENYAWILVEVKDYDDPLEFSMEYGSLQFDYSPGDYKVSWVYTGETDEGRNVRHGEAWSGRCAFSEPPEIIIPGDTVTLDLSITETENSLLGAWWVECTPTGYFFYQMGSDPSNPDPHVYFKDDAGISYFNVNTYEDFPPLNKSISAAAPGGKPGNRIHLILSFQFDDAGDVKEMMRTVYIYEMKKQ